MKYLTLSFILIFLVGANSSTAQSKKDSLKLRADIEALKDGKHIEPQKTDTASILKKNSRPAPAIDSNALKPTPPSPTPPSPNNPNPYEPQPNPMNPNLPATPSPDPVVPPGAPKGPGSAAKQ